MASTFSPSLRLELIGAGEQQGTWGATTNRNLGTLLEGAIAGHSTVSVTSAAQALTALTGADDQARKASVTLTTTTGAAFAVYVPPAPKLYVVRNSSAYVATIYCSDTIGSTTAAGAGVAIPAGKTMSLWTDGTDVLVQSSLHQGDVVGNVTGNVTGNLTGNLVGAAPTAPTAAPGTDTTQVSTTAFVNAAIATAVAATKSALYPVGSIYTNAAVDTNPATLLGFGTWVAFGAGRVPVGQDTGDVLFDVLQETGGSKDAVVVSHTHNLSSAGAHTHSVDIQQLNSNSDVGYGRIATGGAWPEGVIPDITTSAASDHTHTVASAGVSGTNANLPPYIVVKMWRRTA